MKKYGLEAEFLSVKRYTLALLWLYSVYHETIPKRRI